MDRLKVAYATLVDAADRLSWFRDLTLFPGVEITVAGGFHLLAIFDPEGCGQTITRVLAKSEVTCRSEGDADGRTTWSMENVLRVVVDCGGVAIPAHVDELHGLLETEGGETSCTRTPEYHLDGTSQLRLILFGRPRTMRRVADLPTLRDLA